MVKTKSALKKKGKAAESAEATESDSPYDSPEDREGGASYKAAYTSRTIKKQTRAYTRAAQAQASSSNAEEQSNSEVSADPSPKSKPPAAKAKRTSSRIKKSGTKDAKTARVEKAGKTAKAGKAAPKTSKARKAGKTVKPAVKAKPTRRQAKKAKDDESDEEEDWTISESKESIDPSEGNSSPGAKPASKAPGKKPTGRGKKAGTTSKSKSVKRGTRRRRGKRENVRGRNTPTSRETLIEIEASEKLVLGSDSSSFAEEEVVASDEAEGSSDDSSMTLSYNCDEAILNSGNCSSSSLDRSSLASNLQEAVDYFPRCIIEGRKPTSKKLVYCQPAAEQAHLEALARNRRHPPRSINLLGAKPDHQNAKAGMADAEDFKDQENEEMADVDAGSPDVASSDGEIEFDVGSDEDPSRMLGADHTENSEGEFCLDSPSNYKVVVPPLLPYAPKQMVALSEAMVVTAVVNRDNAAVELLHKEVLSKAAPIHGDEKQDIAEGVCVQDGQVVGWNLPRITFDKNELEDRNIEGLIQERNGVTTKYQPSKRYYKRRAPSNEDAIEPIRLAQNSTQKLTHTQDLPRTEKPSGRPLLPRAPGLDVPMTNSDRSSGKSPSRLPQIEEEIMETKRTIMPSLSQPDEFDDHVDDPLLKNREIRAIATKNQKIDVIIEITDQNAKFMEEYKEQHGDVIDRAAVEALQALFPNESRIVTTEMDRVDLQRKVMQSWNLAGDRSSQPKEASGKFTTDSDLASDLEEIKKRAQEKSSAYRSWKDILANKPRQTHLHQKHSPSKAKLIKLKEKKRVLSSSGRTLSPLEFKKPVNLKNRQARKKKRKQVLEGHVRATVGSAEMASPEDQLNLNRTSSDEPMQEEKEASSSLPAAEPVKPADRADQAKTVERGDAPSEEKNGDSDTFGSVEPEVSLPSGGIQEAHITQGAHQNSGLDQKEAQPLGQQGTSPSSPLLQHKPFLPESHAPPQTQPPPAELGSSLLTEFARLEDVLARPPPEQEPHLPQPTGPQPNSEASATHQASSSPEATGKNQGSHPLSQPVPKVNSSPSDSPPDDAQAQGENPSSDEKTTQEKNVEEVIGRSIPHGKTIPGVFDNLMKLHKNVPSNQAEHPASGSGSGSEDDSMESSESEQSAEDARLQVQEYREWEESKQGLRFGNSDDGSDGDEVDYDEDEDGEESEEGEDDRDATSSWTSMKYSEMSSTGLSIDSHIHTDLYHQRVLHSSQIWLYGDESYDSLECISPARLSISSSSSSSNCSASSAPLSKPEEIQKLEGTIGDLDSLPIIQKSVLRKVGPAAEKKLKTVRLVRMVDGPEPSKDSSGALEKAAAVPPQEIEEAKIPLEDVQMTEESPVAPSAPAEEVLPELLDEPKDFEFMGPSKDDHNGPKESPEQLGSTAKGDGSSSVTSTLKFDSDNDGDDAKKETSEKPAASQDEDLLNQKALEEEVLYLENEQERVHEVVVPSLTQLSPGRDSSIMNELQVDNLMSVRSKGVNPPVLVETQKQDETKGAGSMKPMLNDDGKAVQNSPEEGWSDSSACSCLSDQLDDAADEIDEAHLCQQMKEDQASLAKEAKLALTVLESQISSSEVFRSISAQGSMVELPTYEELIVPKVILEYKARSKQAEAAGALKRGTFLMIDLDKLRRPIAVDLNPYSETGANEEIAKSRALLEEEEMHRKQQSQLVDYCNFDDPNDLFISLLHKPQSSIDHVPDDSREFFSTKQKEQARLIASQDVSLAKAKIVESEIVSTPEDSSPEVGQAAETAPEKKGTSQPTNSGGSIQATEPTRAVSFTDPARSPQLPPGDRKTSSGNDWASSDDAPMQPLVEIKEKQVGSSGTKFRYYVTFTNLNRRLDQWIGEEAIDSVLDIPREEVKELTMVKTPVAQTPLRDGAKTPKSESTASAGTPIQTRSQFNPDSPEEELEKFFDNDEDYGIEPEYRNMHSESSAVRTIENVQFSTKCRVRAWYFSFLPQEFQNLECLFVCENCLTFFQDEPALEFHLNDTHRARPCVQSVPTFDPSKVYKDDPLPPCFEVLPPGHEIYRDNVRRVFQVCAKKERVYCENLCHLAKLFLDHKNVKFSCRPFNFYVLVERRQEFMPDGTEAEVQTLAGYYSREPDGGDFNLNLSCILVFPHCQRRGHGRFLVEFSYSISRRLKERGTPERPLSDLGYRTYLPFWAQHTILHLLENYTSYGGKNREDIEEYVTIQEVADGVQFDVSDVKYVLENFRIFRRAAPQHYLYLNREYLSLLLEGLGVPYVDGKFKIREQVDQDKLYFRRPHLSKRYLSELTNFNPTYDEQTLQ